MKVIFLDVDGVLCTSDCLRMRLAPTGHHVFNPACVGALNDIIAATGAKLVLSSSWRHFMSIRKFNTHSKAFGVPPCIDETPTLSQTFSADGLYIAQQRGTEIKAWLDAHPEVDKFVILDDNSDMASLMDFLIQTDMDRGLTEYHAKRAIKLLNS